MSGECESINVQLNAADSSRLRGHLGVAATRDLMNGRCCRRRPIPVSGYAIIVGGCVDVAAK